MIKGMKETKPDSTQGEEGGDIRKNGQSTTRAFEKGYKVEPKRRRE